jgi:copper chaperone
MTDRIDIEVKGMTCDGCVNAVRRVVSRVEGVRSVEVDLAAGRAVVTGAFEPEGVAAAIRKAGYVPGEAR